MSGAPAAPGTLGRGTIPTEPTPVELPGFVPGFVGMMVESRPVRHARLVLEVYGLAGGGLLAAGIAYRVLFALAPAVLLLVAILGLAIDEEARAAVIERLSEAFPPLADILAAAVEAVAEGAAPMTIVSAAILLWGASGLYLAVEEGVARMIPFGPMRDPARRTLFGLLSVVIVVGGLVALFVGGAAFGLISRLGPFTDDVGAIPISVADVLLLAGAVVVVTAAYRFLPMARPPWSAAIIPGIAAGLAITALSVLYVWIAPRLAGLSFLYGSLATVLVSLAWVGLVAQALLVGAAWTAVRWSRALIAVPSVSDGSGSA